jgi:acyl-CoA thioesterase-1
VLRVLFLGTSLTEGLGLAAPEVEAWPARVRALAQSRGLELQVVNAGLGGETSAGTLRRVDWVLQQDPDVLVVETGANDGLRALPTGALEENLLAIIVHVREARPETELVLVPMEAPPNMGPEYTSSFREVFLRAAAAGRVPLTRFLLDGVAGIPELNQPDRIHPTASGHQRMAENTWPVLDSVFRVAIGRRASAGP